MWSDADLDRMSFHDVKVHAFASRVDDRKSWNYSLLFDIDYIIQWILPAPGSNYTFAVSPATLVFENVSRVRFEGDPMTPEHLLDVNSLTRHENPPAPGAVVPTFTWTIECHDGTVTLDASGFKLYIRRPPVLSQEGSLDDAARGGISFAECRVVQSTPQL